MRSSSNGTRDSSVAAGKSRSASNDDSQHYAEEKGAAALVELYDAPIPGKQVLDLNVPLAQLLPTYDAARLMLSLCISRYDCMSLDEVVPDTDEVTVSIHYCSSWTRTRSRER